MDSVYRRFIGGRSAGDAGAMAQNNGKTSTVRNCTFAGNEAQFGFVAALEQNAITNTRVLGCTFTRNRGERPVFWRRAAATHLVLIPAQLLYKFCNVRVLEPRVLAAGCLLGCRAALWVSNNGDAGRDGCGVDSVRAVCAAGPNNGALVHQGCDTVLIQDTTFVSNTGTANLPRIGEFSRSRQCFTDTQQHASRPQGINASTVQIDTVHCC